MAKKSKARTALTFSPRARANATASGAVFGLMPQFQSNVKVVLLDRSSRRPSFHKLLGLVVWRLGTRYVRRRYGTHIKRGGIAAGGTGLLVVIGIAAVLFAKSSREPDDGGI